MHLFRYIPSRAAKVTTGHDLRPSVMALACAAIAAFGFTAGTLKAREISNQPGLRDILADLAAGRNVSARVSLPLQIGFFQTADKSDCPNCAAASRLSALPLLIARRRVIEPERM
jgi:hypothetical protein